MLRRPRESVWYGLDPVQVLPFQATARRRFGRRLTSTVTADRLTYVLAGLTLPGRKEAVAVEVRFHRDTGYGTFGLAPQDYPEVFADPSAKSPHRMPSGALCLYAPFDPPDQRWEWSDGLEALIELTGEHLTREHLWRHTRANGHARWLGLEAPHGLPR